MERIGEIMQKLGFKEDGDDRVKAAFIKNLVRQAYGVEISVPQKYRDLKKESLEGEQLSFDLTDSA